VTCAWGTTAPLGSVIVPESVAVDWPQTFNPNIPLRASTTVALTNFISTSQKLSNYKKRAGAEQRRKIGSSLEPLTEEIFVFEEGISSVLLDKS
jgi:hypothetical protein